MPQKFVVDPDDDSNDMELGFIEVEINGELFKAPFFEVRGEEEAIDEALKQSGGALYTLLYCDGAEVLLRGRHLVNRAGYVVMPAHASEEITLWKESEV